MRHITSVSLSSLIRVGAVHRVHLLPYTPEDGGGWRMSVDHADPGLERDVRTKRGSIRLWRSTDSAIRWLSEAGYRGPIHVYTGQQGGQV